MDLEEGWEVVLDGEAVCLAEDLEEAAAAAAAAEDRVVLPMGPDGAAVAVLVVCLRMLRVHLEQYQTLRGSVTSALLTGGL